MNYLLKLSFLLMFFAASNLSFAQTETETLQEEIDDQVWKPFCEAYAAMDAEKFNSVHSDDVVRATPWGIRIGEEYKASNRKNMVKKEGKSRTIELRFEHRITKTDFSYEVGYYKVLSQDTGKEPREDYGRFHCVIKKVDGTWKIVQDWDDNDINGHKVGAEDWAKIAPANF